MKHRDCNIKVKLNHNFPIIFHNLKNFDSHIIMQELGKFDFEIHVALDGLEKYINFNISTKLVFIDSFQFLSFLLESLVKNLTTADFRYLS